MRLTLGADPPRLLDAGAGCDKQNGRRLVVASVTLDERGRGVGKDRCPGIGSIRADFGGDLVEGLGPVKRCILVPASAMPTRQVIVIRWRRSNTSRQTEH